MAGFDLVLSPPGAGGCAAGVFAILSCLAIPWLVWRKVVQGVPAEGFVVADPRRKGNCLAIFFLGAGEWVSRRPDPHWVHRWTAVVRSYRGPTAWYVVVEFAASFAVSATHASTPETLAGCGHVKLASGAIFLILLAVEMAVWPHIHDRNNHLDTLALLCNAVAMGALAVGYYRGRGGDATIREHVEFDVAGGLLTGAVALLILRAVLDVVVFVYVVCSGRRTELQHIVWERHLRRSSTPSLTASTPPPAKDTGTLTTDLRAATIQSKESEERDLGPYVKRMVSFEDPASGSSLLQPAAVPTAAKSSSSSNALLLPQNRMGSVQIDLSCPFFTGLDTGSPRQMTSEVGVGTPLQGSRLIDRVPLSSWSASQAEFTRPNRQGSCLGMSRLLPQSPAGARRVASGTTVSNPVSLSLPRDRSRALTSLVRVDPLRDAAKAGSLSSQAIDLDRDL
eukprot:TRINITY_DN18333_c0_g1_i1.p1 TRINITY_DN18333_c0_g1~~TRINITY_DN18333_c0_g1_i1.p1  ORF type:complete len:498 (+),score=94.83 TRINITY_DN18333_c0_g1_i1:142-1494(+)